MYHFNNIMKYSLEISKIIEGSIKYDYAKVKNYTHLLIEKLKSDGDYVAANKIERLFETTGANTLGFANVQTNVIPIDQESKIKIADIYYPSSNDYLTILNSNNMKQIQLFVSSVKQSDILNKYGLDGNNTLLLYGPPGCGKTNCAFMIAKLLNLPIVVAR